MKPHCEVAHTTRSQAERIIAKFGNARNLSKALSRLEDQSQHRTPAVIYRWTYPKAKGGTGGHIPSNALAGIIQAARLEGVLITKEELYGSFGSE